MLDRSRIAAEITENLRLAGPVILAQLAGVRMGAVDTLFAGRLGPESLAAIAVGVNLNAVVFVFSMGLLMACSPIIAQLRGRGALVGEIGRFMREARAFSLLVGLSWFALLNVLAGPVVQRLHLGAMTADIAIRFLHALSFSAFGFALWFVQRFCAEGGGDTRPVFLSGLVGLACNAVLDWLLVFGHFGLPALGAMGCGVATALSSLLMAGVLTLGMGRSPQLRIYASSGLPRPGPVPAQSGPAEIMTVGVPIAFIMLAEAGLFVLAAMLMARFGDDTVAAYQVAINFAALMFMIPLGIGQATTVRVGLAVGAADPAAARLRGQLGMLLGLVNAASNAAIMVLFGGIIARLYTHDAGIAALAAHFLLLAAAFQVFDGVQVTANGALRGLKDSRMPLILTVLAYWAF